MNYFLSSAPHEKRAWLIEIEAHSTLTISITIVPAPESEVSVIVLTQTFGSSQCSVISKQQHTSPHSRSEFLCKTVAYDRSHFSYNGSIFITPEGNHSHAYQRNENLIIGEEAHVRSEPVLEIEANDVFCTHGVATSSISPSELWYLQSRSFSPQRAKELIVDGFLAVARDKLKNYEHIRLSR